MACQPGYIELNGNCVYAFGNDSGVGPDGTPLPQTNSGGFWDWMKKNLPDILVTAGSVLQNRNGNDQPATPSGGQPQPTPKQDKIPVWVWILLAVAVIIIVFLLLRNSKTNVA